MKNNGWEWSERKYAQFPSPCGELVMKNGDYWRRRTLLHGRLVSIPLRGIGYEKRCEYSKARLEELGFHPLAGNWL